MSHPVSFDSDLVRLVPASAKSVQCRLMLEPTGSHQGMLDGGWWPRSRMPGSELPGLIMKLDAVRGQVLRLVLAGTGWDDWPRRLAVGDRVILLDYFGSQPATLLTALCVNSRVDLFVVPPATSRTDAHAAMTRALATGNRWAARLP